VRCAFVRGAGLLGAILALTGIAAPRAPAAVAGKQRVLVVLAAYGARPFARDQMTQAVAQADAFLRKSSYGRMSLETTVTPWLDAGFSAPSCAVGRTVLPEPLLTPVRAAARQAGYNLAAYDRLLYSVADSDCVFQGAAAGEEVLLTRTPDMHTIVHELGHTWGLAHAAAAERCGTFCVTQEEGDPFTPMGIGFGDFSAYEKELLGWIEPQPRVTRPGRYVVYPTAARSGLHALVLNTADGQYWLEQRPDRTTPALIVRVVHPEEPNWPFAPASTLLLGPIHPGHATILPGQTFTVHRAFSVRLGLGKKTPAQLRLKLSASFR
jgi:Metallo-peptidase family M12B Reprolysin-like